MRWLILILLLPLAAGQSLTGTTSATIESDGALIGQGGVAVRPLEVTLTATGFLCTSDATVVVPLRLDVVGNVSAVLEPDRLEFTLPAGTSVAASTSSTRTAVLVVRGNESATATVSTMAPSVGCVSAQRGADALGAASIDITWSQEPTASDAPEQIMPGPVWVVLLALLGLARRNRDNGPKYG